MARSWGETLARLVDRRIAAPVANTAAITAIAAADRINGMQIIETTNGTAWWFDDDSVAVAGPSVLVPDAGTGRWLSVSGGAGGPSTKIVFVRGSPTGALAAYTRTGNVIQANANGALGAQDGVTYVAAERLLLRTGAAGADNGPYQVTQVGTAGTPFILTRIGEADASAEVVSGMFVHVSEGTFNADLWYTLTTNDPITLNTTALTFVQLPDYSDTISADASLTVRVSTEESTRLSADTSLTTRVSTEESTGLSADTSLNTRVSTEESTRLSADTSLTTRVSTEESTGLSADTSLTTRVSTEESTRASADLSLTTRVSTEESTRLSADTSLTTADTSVTTRVSTEESTRTSADLSLTTRVSTEESTRLSADTSLTTRVSTEESTGLSADTSLNTRVSTEESTRASADTSLTTRVSTEESTRLSADTSIVTRFVTGYVLVPLQDFREVDANGDYAAAAAFAGVLASDSTPAIQGGTNEDTEISWAIANTDIVSFNTSLPGDFNGAQDVTVRMWVSSGAAGPNPATFTLNTSWDQGAQVVDTATDGAAGAARHEITATIAAADIPDAADTLTLQLVPAAHAADPIQLHGIRIEYAKNA